MTKIASEFFVAFSKYPKSVILVKPQLHIHGFGPGRATVHPDLSNRGALA